VIADVLVLGGGPAGAWAAIAAAEAGAQVVLADKGYLGTSGAAAAGGNNLWYLPPEPAAREQSIARRQAEGGGLSDPSWMHRTLDTTWASVARLDDWGYPFPTDHHGVVRRSSLQGPEYMRLMRTRVKRLGVRILDHHPAAELLTDADGVVSGAAGLRRQAGNGPWSIRAGAVILATGGCAFLSGALGCNPDTGDGHLMAAELGAQLSGMEFSAAYGMAPGFGTQTKGRIYQFARYYHADGTPMDLPPGFAGRAAVARSMLTEVVHARLDEAPSALHDALRWAQPNFFLPYDKAGIDPFRDLFPVRMIMEGTVRGTGGLRIVDDGCATTVPGLFAAGDAATRELITGGRTGGGSHNGAWAMSSGTWAGRAAAGFARTHRPTGATTPNGRAGLRAATTAAVDERELLRVIQATVTPLEVNLFRHGDRLRSALDTLHGLWSGPVAGLGEAITNGHRPRELAAMVAHGRWMFTSALARTESRAMHQREDAPGADPEQQRRLLVGGLDELWVAPEESRALELAS
jgi:succinate dehydrogenase/fumarate reductase flavoprotein subunit